MTDDERRRRASRYAGGGGTAPDGEGPREASRAASGDGEQTLGQLVASMTDDVSALVRGEVDLLKAELRESAMRAAKGASLFGAAGFLGYVAFLLLSVAAAYGLVALGLHPALGFLIVAVLYLLLAGLLAYVGKRNLDKAGPPKKAIAELETSRDSVKALLKRS